ncbi:ribonuclease P protein component [Pusillimonas sp. ANT_WB101]|uniref:ribonuclease P protein component n=1 Tax=Pusillimonas sp. ANT_WB101 TaxID=2597356 RepID=UPI0011ED5FE6|nr:ribonuclease P protein component [Pusillimonas sp. ANT_WB101]KAA0891212.1 ribonuclease P protein component [Pusillimonas sp. ANT_WB101]NYT75849.1 ribonuclease P protein component [Alcaligenaceae bacterium]
MMRATFPPAARLHRPSEFASALKGRRIARGALFVVNTPRPAPDGVHADTGTCTEPRLGLIIAKRFAARSVTRNAIKRVLREAFRQKRHALPCRDYVIRLNAKVADQSLTQLKKQVRAEVDALLEQVCR